MISRALAAACLVFLAPCASRRTHAAEPRVREGDLVFEQSTSSQSAAIRWATGSPWTHVGLVVDTPRGLAVVEALGKVTPTPWSAWRKRARRGGDVLVLRPRGLDARARAAVAARARELVGRPYDARFGWDDRRIYCSELVVKAFERGAGVVLGRRQRLGDLRLTGLQALAEARWGGPIPEDLVLVTPASLAQDPRLAPVYRGPP